MAVDGIPSVSLEIRRSHNFNILISFTNVAKAEHSCDDCAITNKAESCGATNYKFNVNHLHNPASLVSSLQ
jgi:hypothetical protein